MKKKILFSWISLNNDLKKNPGTGLISGPTLEILRQQAYDYLFLLFCDEKSKNLAQQFKKFVHKENTATGKTEIELRFIKLTDPSDYESLWKVLPNEIDRILDSFSSEENDYYVNISAGTPAMTTTWIMMLGSGQLKATALSPQINWNTGEIIIKKINTGIFPFIERIYKSVDQKLRVQQKFQ